MPGWCCTRWSSRRTTRSASAVWASRAASAVARSVVAVSVVAGLLVPCEVSAADRVAPSSGSLASGFGNDLLGPGQVALGVELGFDLPTPVGIGARLLCGLPGMVQVTASASTALLALNWAVGARTVILGRHSTTSLGIDVSIGQWFLMASGWVPPVVTSPRLVLDHRRRGGVGLTLQAGMWAEIGPRGLQVLGPTLLVGTRWSLGPSSHLGLEVGSYLRADLGGALPIGRIAWIWTPSFGR